MLKNKMYLVFLSCLLLVSGLSFTPFLPTVAAVEATEKSQTEASATQALEVIEQEATRLPEGPEPRISGALAAYGLTEGAWQEATLFDGGFHVKNAMSFDYSVHGIPMTGYLGVSLGRLDGLSFSAGEDDNLANRLKFLHHMGDGATTGMWSMYGTGAIDTATFNYLDRAVYVNPGMGQILTQKSGDTVALQLRGTTVDGRLNMRSTMLNLPDGRVRYIYEMTNATSGSLNVGFVRKLDLMLDGTYIVPVFSLGVGKGAYLSNNKFRVTFPKSTDNPYIHNNYFIGDYWEKNPFGGRMTGTGHETNAAYTTDYKIQDNSDNTLFLKWNTQSLARNATRVISFDVGLQMLSAPVITVPDSKRVISLNEGEKYVVKGTWVDKDSTKVSLNQKTNASAFAKFADGTRPESAPNQETPFEYTIDASKLNKGTNTVSFKAIDITGLESNVEEVEVYVGNETTLTTNYLNKEGEAIIPPKVEKVAVGEVYSTDGRADYIEENFGYVQDGSPVNNVGVAGQDPIVVNYEYKKGKVRLTVEHRDTNNKPIPGIDDEVSVIDMMADYKTESLDLSAQGYKLKTTPLNAEGTSKTVDIVVTYVYSLGERKLVKVPAAIDFGVQKLLTFGTKEIMPTENIKVDILDELPGSWDLKLRILEPIKSSVSDKEIEGAFKFVKNDGGSVPITDTATTVQSKGTITEADIALEWDKTNDRGLSFEQWTGNLNEEYNGVFEWSLVNGP